MSKYKDGKRVTFYSLLGKIGDVLLWPIMIISLFSSFFMIVQRQQNKVTSIFGYSFVNVLSGSMVDEGFQIRDTVITKQVSERDVKLGDIIAFYYQISTQPVGTTHLVMGYNYSTGKHVDYSEENIQYGNYGSTVAEISANLREIEKTDKNGQALLTKAQESKARIYFHRVIGIYIDDAGNMFYKTKGSNNSSADTPLARGDLLVGTYVNTPTVVRKAVSFCASTTGMIILVCFPLSLLVLMQCLSLIDQVSIISIERRLITGKIPFEDESVQKDMTGSQMEVYNKVYYYFITPPEKKKVVKEYLWKDLLSTLVLPPKQAEEFNLVKKSLEVLERSDEEYWNVWIENTKGGVRKKLLKYKEQCLGQKQEEAIEENITENQVTEEQKSLQYQSFNNGNGNIKSSEQNNVKQPQKKVIPVRLTNNALPQKQANVRPVKKSDDIS